MSDPGFQMGIAAEIGVHQTTVSKTIKEVMHKITAKQSEWIVFPTTSEAIRKTKEMWELKYKFPNVIGVIDCTHVCIEKPGEFGDEFINRKGKATINVQATCDSTEKFTSIDVNWPGSVHDSRILKNSLLFQFMNSIQTDAIILGDEGYGISNWLMVPFRNPQSESEKAFNRIMTSERVIIERCFGMLKRRFPILAYKIRLSVSDAPKIILCCVILHNISKHLNETDCEFEDEEFENEDPLELDDTNDRERATRIKGQRRRLQLANQIVQLYN